MLVLLLGLMASAVTPNNVETAVAQHRAADPVGAETLAYAALDAIPELPDPVDRLALGQLHQLLAATSLAQGDSQASDTHLREACAKRLPSEPWLPVHPKLVNLRRRYEEVCAANDGSGTLVLDRAPIGWDVYVDGERTRAANVEVMEGHHWVQVLPVRGTGAPWARRYDVETDARLDIRHGLDGPYRRHPALRKGSLAAVVAGVMIGVGGSVSFYSGGEGSCYNDQADCGRWTGSILVGASGGAVGGLGIVGLVLDAVGRRAPR